MQKRQLIRLKKVLFFLVTLNFFSNAQISDIVIANVLDTLNSSDYLIITPQEFVENALRLAVHRNSYTNDSVFQARIVILEDIYQTFTTPNPKFKHKIIWNGLQWFYKHWHKKFTTVLFIGDDSLVFNPTDSLYYSYGRMPSFIESENMSNKEIYFSDDWYSTIYLDSCPDANDFTDTLLHKIRLDLGRIPCETNQQLSDYIEKVISFDTHAPHGPWRNRMCIIADDFYQGPIVDPLCHYLNTESLSLEFVEDYSITKCYLALFPKGPDNFHSIAKKFYLNTINCNPPLWTIYFGHGHSSTLSDENFLIGNDVSGFKNDSTPVIFLSFSCLNGSFHKPFNNSMCKKFLFKPKGATLLYIASARSGYASQNDRFAQRIFQIYKKHTDLSLGTFISQAKNEKYHSCRNYHLLGDPAIRLSLQQLTMSIAVDREKSKIHGTVLSPVPFVGHSNAVFSLLKTEKLGTVGNNDFFYKKETPLTSSVISCNSSFEFALPKIANTDTLKCVFYLWNETMEGRIDTVVTGITTAVGFKFVSLTNYVSITNTNSTHLCINFKLSGITIKIISLYNLKGQRVYFQTVLLSNSGSYSFDLLNKNIAPGNYIVNIQTTIGSINKVFSFSL